MLSEWLTHSPKESCIPNILFRRCLWVALLWKYLELLSPSTSQNTFACYLHILFSFTNSSLISIFKPLTRELLPLCIASYLALTNHFLFPASCLLTWPKFFRLQCVSSFPHFSIFLITWLSASQGIVLLHTTSTTHPHPLSEIHISSNRKGLELGGGSIPLGTIHKGKWSEVVHVRCMTLVLENGWANLSCTKLYLVSPKLIG